jgi:hypothetical protein
MATTTKIIDIEEVCNNAHNVIDQLAKLFDEYFATPIADPLQLEITPMVPTAPKGGAPTTSPSLQLPQSIANPKLPSGEISTAPILAPWSPTTPTSTMALVIIGDINNLQPYFNKNKEGCIIFITEEATFGAAVFLKPCQRPSKAAA